MPTSPVASDSAVPNAVVKKKSRDSVRGPFFSSPFALVFALALVFYLFLLPPSIVRGGDCGELIAASFNLGIAHPSGYPLWCLLGRLFAFLPWGEVAWRYNLFSALCGALAAALIASTSQLLLDSETEKARVRWACMGTGLLLAGFFFFGSQALLAEVYAFAALEGSALLFFALRWKRGGDWRDLYTFTWLAGLSPLIHLSGVFLWPILGIWALWRQKGLTARRIACLGALWASGWVLALYFPLRSGHFPAPPVAALDSYFYFPLDWGHPATFAALKAHLTAAQYNGLLQPRPLPDLIENAFHLGEFLFFQYLWATPLLLWGARSAFKHGVGWVLVVIFVLNVGVEIQYDVSDQSNFFFPAYLVMALWMGLGWFEFLGWLEARGLHLARGAAASLWPWRLRTLGTALLLATVGAQWFLFGATSNGRGVLRPRDGAIEAATAAQGLAMRAGRPVAALYTYDDTLWALWYAKYVLGLMPDVETPWGRGLSRLTEGGRLVDYVAQLKKSGPVVLAQWDARTDARFPLQMITPSGNLCVASDQAFPSSAAPLIASGTPIPGAQGLVRAKFRRARLWQGQNGVPALSPASLAAFEVDFRVPPRPGNGMIEVLIAKSAYFGAKKPSLTQQSVAQGSKETGHVLVSHQQRRLILPANARPGAVMRMAVPLQIEATSPVGNYEVWTRIGTPSEVGNTPWTRTDAVRLTVK